MSNPPNPSRHILLVALATTAACSAPRIAGSIDLRGERPCMLLVKSAEAAEVRMQLQNLGPGEVDVRQRHPDGEGGVARTARRRPGVRLGGDDRIELDEETTHVHVRGLR